MNTRLKKPEAVHIQGLCVLCKTCLQMSRGGGNYRPVCTKCHLARSKRNPTNRPYQSFKKDYCEACRFVALHPCQLDVDHINGDHEDNRSVNLQTLCANCHRFKTWLNKDWENKGA